MYAPRLRLSNIYDSNNTSSWYHIYTKQIIYFFGGMFKLALIKNKDSQS